MRTPCARRADLRDARNSGTSAGQDDRVRTLRRAELRLAKLTKQCSACVKGGVYGGAPHKSVAYQQASSSCTQYCTSGLLAMAEDLLAQAKQMSY